MVSPQISVVMSCYNGARWLREAIESILDQSFKEFEFIIVDDGSTDASPLIMDEYAQRDKRIHVFHKMNSGLADSLNVGMAQARGEWIARIDADDISRPDRLAKQMAFACHNPDAIYVGSGMLEIDEKGAMVNRYSYPHTNAKLKRYLRDSLKFPPHSSAFYRKDVVKSVGGFRDRIQRAEDCDLWLRLSEIGRFACLSEPLVRIRKHSLQISHDASGYRQLVDARAALASYWLRQWGHADPVEASEETWRNFYEFVSSRVVQSRICEYLAFVAAMKQTFLRFSLRNVCLAILAAVLNPAFVLLHFHNRTFGEDLAKRIAAEWMAKKRASSACQGTSASDAARPTISVVMACFNANGWVGEAIDSILNQTHTDFELIIVDDGSVDGTSQTLAEACKRDRRVRVTSKSNTGLADSLNIGIRQARGEWIARIDADDISEPERLERQLSIVQRNPMVVYVGTGHTEIDEFGRPLRQFRYPKKHSDLVRHLREGRAFPAHSSSLLSRQALLSLGGYRARFRRAQDYDLWLRLSESGRFAVLDHPLVRIRKHRYQISLDEDSMLQVLDSRIALTSFWLRHYGHADPVDADEKTFLNFKSFVQERVAAQSTAEYVTFIREFRGLIDPTRRFMTTVAIQTRNPWKSRYVLRSFSQLAFGERAPRLWARQWAAGQR